MPIDFSDPRPVYLQIADELRTKIRNGHPRPGERLPSRKAMAEEHGVAPDTVKKALDELAREGLIGTHSTRGTFVIKTPEEAQPSPEYVHLLEELKHLAERMDALEARVQRIDPHRNEVGRERQPASPGAQVDPAGS